MRCAFLLLLLIAFMPCSFAALASPRFSVTDIGVMPLSQRESGPLAINDQGQIVGCMAVRHHNDHAFLWRSGRMKDLGALAVVDPEYGSSSIAYSINSRGQSVGSSGDYRLLFMSGLVACVPSLFEKDAVHPLVSSVGEAFGINDKDQIVGGDGVRGFLYENGKLIELGTLSKVPQGNRSEARSINNRGQIIGWSTAGKELSDHAFLWQRSKRLSRMQDLGTLPFDQSSQATGINDKGQVVGFSSSNTTSGLSDSYSQACLWQGKRVYGLGRLPGGRKSQAFSINNSGRIVGSSEINHPLHSPFGDIHACLWRSGVLYDLNTLIPSVSGWTLTEATAINNKGQIVGNGVLNGQRHGFLLTPCG